MYVALPFLKFIYLIREGCCFPVVKIMLMNWMVFRMMFRRAVNSNEEYEM